MAYSSIAEKNRRMALEDWLSPLESDYPPNHYQEPAVPAEIRHQIYRRLNSNPQDLHIRLLEIEPHDADGGLISCILRQIPLEDAGEYYALSYYWGDANEQQHRIPIFVNGFEFKVQPNLWDALHALRCRGHNVVWADAICLDQDDDEEKAQQVPHMKIIYQRARGVAIWLGKEADGSGDLIRLIKGLAKTEISQEYAKKMMRTFPELEEWAQKLSPYTQQYNHVLECLEIFLGEQALQAALEGGENSPERKFALEGVEELTRILGAFFRRPYWRRMWVIQEVAAGRSVAIFCGAECLLWNDLSTLKIFDDGATNWNDLADIGAHNWDMIRRLRSKVENGVPIGLLTALQCSYGFEAGRTQDKIYALLGLAWNSDRYVNTVSYAPEFTLNRILHDIASQWMAGGFLDVICLQPLEVYNDRNQPSWMPKWLAIGRSDLTSRLVDSLENRKPTDLLPKFPHKWKATDRSRSLNHTILDNRRVLSVRGVHVDTVDGLSAACDADPEDPSLKRHWDSKCPAPERVDTMKMIRRDLYWTLFMYKAESANGIPDQGLNIDVLWSEELRTYLAQEEMSGLSDWLQELLKFRLFGRPFECWLKNRPFYRNTAKLLIMNKLIKHDEDRTFRDQHNATLIDAIQKVFRDGRRLMTTRAGRVGWAHPSARPGDRIYLIEGCNLPVILAPCNVPYDGWQTCQLVGDAYVHGIMYGGLWESVESELTTLFLR